LNVYFSQGSVATDLGKMERC